jgi:L-ascorbate metabolism protein UlaG (beta-lactamase superfamily)
MAVSSGGLTRRMLLAGGAGFTALAATSLVSRAAMASAPRQPQPRLWPDRGFFGAWLGHATVLLKIDGFTIITDPMFSSVAGVHLGPFSFGIRRSIAPALAPQDLPRPDLILISHVHMDHLDIPSMRALEDKRTQVVMASDTSDLVRGRRYGLVRELRWGGVTMVGPVRIRAFEVKHWGARVRTDTYRGYNGYILECGRYRVLFGGDTAMSDSFATVRRTKPFDVALMPIGCYNPWRANHCTPEEALAMANAAGAERIVPIHHLTFDLSNEPWEEPLDRLLTATGRAEDRVIVRRVGDEFRC